MRPILSLICAGLLAGCATERPVVMQSPPPVVVAAVPSKRVETRYDLRSYRDAANPAIRHEAHAVYRQTRVPTDSTESLETVSRVSFAPASVAPLPASDELTAELATQKAITANMRGLQASMAETERRMQAQYAQLVRQSAEALKLRQQLEAERSGTRVASASAPSAAPAQGAPEVKW